jgi:SLT domain-containing protein
MQTIMATFTAYHQAGTSNNIYDPVANIAAAINYIRATYGTVFNTPGIKSIARGGGYVGYDSGGYLMPGLTLAYNGTGHPEMVSPPGSGAADGTLHAIVNIDGKSVFDALTPYAYQKASRNSGNGNAAGYWTPGNGSRGR